TSEPSPMEFPTLHSRQRALCKRPSNSALTPSSWRRLALILKPLFFLKPMLLGLALSLASLSIQAGPREQAKQMHDRLTGVPPSEEVLNQMAEEIRLGNALAAADIAMENPAFYTATLKRMA